MSLESTAPVSFAVNIRTWMKMLIAVAVVFAVAGYALFLSVTSSYQDTDTWLLHVKDYRFHFRLNFQTFYRSVAAAVAVCVFAAASTSRSISQSTSVSKTSWHHVAIKLIILTIAFWLAIINAFDLEEFDWFVLVSAAAGSAFLLWASEQPRCQSILDVARNTRRLPLLLVAATVTLALSFFLIHKGQAVTTDAQSQIAQARLILSGQFKLILSEPLLAAAQIPNFLLKNPTYSQYPPGHIILLIPFVAAGIPANIINLLCGIAAVGFTYKFCQSISDSKSALFTAILLAASPMFLVMQTSGFNHGSTTMLLMIAAWAFYNAVWKERPGLLWIGVLAFGWAGITRPVTALAHGLIWGPILAAYGWQTFRRHHQVFSFKIPRAAWRTLAAIFVAGALPLTVLAIYNALTTGNPFLLGYSDNDPLMHRLGFFSSGPYPYNLSDAAHYEVADIIYFSQQLFGWPICSWMLILGWLMLTRFSAGELIVVAIIISQITLYRLYHYHDLLMGPRFMSELVPYWTILGGIGLGHLFMATPLHLRGIAKTAIILFAISSVISGIYFWRVKLSTFTTKHVLMEEFMKTLKGNEPRVVVVRPEYGETAGEYVFNQESPIWFVSSKLEEKVRLAPELKGYKWLHPEQFSGP